MSINRQIELNMDQQSYSPFQTLIQKFASTLPGAWFFAHTAHHLDKLFLKLSGGRTTLVHVVSGLPAMMITTIGAKTGLPRTLPLVYIRNIENPSQLAIVASNLGQHHLPGWYYNLKAHPQAECMVDGQVQTYVAREVFDEEYARFWRYTLETYYGYRMYQQHAGRHIPIFVLTPVEHP
jgi:deazaflavin-dependent oxidoreductase (nitroreductase family)